MKCPRCGMEDIHTCVLLNSFIGKQTIAQAKCNICENEWDLSDENSEPSETECYWCRNYVSMSDAATIGKQPTFILGVPTSAGFQPVTPKYCPMCGRKIEEIEEQE